MRDFDHPSFRHARARGRNQLAKPLIVGAVFIVVLCLLVMSLWNALLPALIGVKTIGFWQAAGLLLLCRILFGGLGIRPGMFGHARRRMHERWMQMTPEQRDAFMKQRREGLAIGDNTAGINTGTSSLSRQMTTLLTGLSRR